MNPAFYSVLRALGADRVYGAVARNQPVVLAFHGVTDHAPGNIHNPEGSHLYQPIFRQLVSFVTREFQVVPLLEIARWLRGDADLPPRALAITFDDGYRNVLTHAAPVLREFGAPATVFVTTDFVFEQRALWPDRLLSALASTNEKQLTLQADSAAWAIENESARVQAYYDLCRLLKIVSDSQRSTRVDEVVQALGFHGQPWDAWDGFAPLAPEDLPKLLESGIDVGSHTCSHPIITQCADEQMGNEVRCSKELIEGATGVPCTSFAYPNGTEDDFNDASRQHLMDAGYLCAATTIKRRVTRDDDRFEIPRMMLSHNEMSLKEFAVEVSGLLSRLRQATGRLAGPRRHPAA